MDEIGGRKMAKKTPDIDALLTKNPHVKEIFEKNQAMLAKLPQAKKPGYRLGLPYEDRRPVAGPQDSEPGPKASYLDR